jgi:hypothetical protein
VTRQGVRVARQRLISNRRSGISPGRRFALALAVAVAGLAWPGTLAAADAGSGSGTALLQVTVIGGSAGSGGPRTLTVGQLENCPQYPPDIGSLRLYRQDGTYATQSLSGESWSLQVALSCGFGLSPSDITDVVVQRSNRSYESPGLSDAELGSGPYNDPTAPGASPVVSADPNDANNTQYIRPWMGGSDDNAQDWVPAAGGPIVVQVYENSSPLTVTITPQQTGSTATTTTYNFSATVTDASGNTIPASSLTWSWTFGDPSPSSTLPAPPHTYSISGRVVVSVQATDPSTGASGPGWTTVTIPSGTDTGDTGQKGAGPTGPTGAQPTGQQDPGGNTPGGGQGSHNSPGGGSPTGKQNHKTSDASKHHRHGHKSANHHRSATSNTTGAGTPSGGASSGTGQNGGSSSTGNGVPNSQSSPTSSTQPAAPQNSPQPAPAAKARHTLVNGLLISDLEPVAADRSPLVYSEPAASGSAPQVRRNITASASPLPTVLGALAVLLLLAVGAGRELRWRVTPRILRLGH